MEELKGFLGQMIFRWLLKIIGGYFAIHGALSPDLNDALSQLAGGIAAIVVGIAISVVQHNQAIQTPVPEGKGLTQSKG